MCAVGWLWVVLAFVACSVAEQCEKTCVLTDVDCMTSGAKFILQSVVSHANGSIPLDPLQLKKIEKKRGSTKYKLTNIKLTGLRSCVSDRLGIIVNETLYEYYIHCSKLISTFDYEAKDASHKRSFREKRYRIEAENYMILNKGQYRILIEEKDHQPHGFVKSCQPIFKLKGPLTFDIKHLCGTHKHKSNKFQGCIKNSKKTTAKYLNSLIIKEAMRILLLIRMNGFHKNHLLSEAFPSTPRHKPDHGSLEFILEEIFILNIKT